MSSLSERLRGRFIVFDGPDGGGKSTQIRLLAEQLARDGVSVVTTRDPGGTVIGERVRSVLLDHDLTAMDVRCEMLLFMASRAQLVAEVIDPALKDGSVVLCDRFVSATCAYQGAAGGDPEAIIEMARYAVGELWPHYTVLLDVPAELGFERMRGHSPDAMEKRSLEYHRRVCELFRQLPADYPGQVVHVDGVGDMDAVRQRVLEALERVSQPVGKSS